MTISRSRNAKNRKTNILIAADNGCIHCGKRDGIDPAHFPKRRSQGAGWGLCEFVPLCREQHTLYDTGKMSTRALAVLAEVAKRYYTRMYLVYRDDPKTYLGPPELIQEMFHTDLQGELG